MFRECLLRALQALSRVIKDGEGRTVGHDGFPPGSAVKSPPAVQETQV